jgi:hypothetical protein
VTIASRFVRALVKIIASSRTESGISIVVFMILISINLGSNSSFFGTHQAQMHRNAQVDHLWTVSLSGQVG